MYILKSIKEDIKKNKRAVAIALLLLVFLILVTIFGEEGPGEEKEPKKYKFSYAINISEVEIVNGIPFLYTLESKEVNSVLYYPEPASWYFYEDSLGHTWLAQGEKRKEISEKHYSDITIQRILKIYKGKTPLIRKIFEDDLTDRFYVENIEGNMILLIPDTEGTVKTRNFLIESQKKLDEIIEEISLESE